ncbi:MAG TPA: hypothetical protein V6D26_01965 [Stenomitos sp.]
MSDKIPKLEINSSVKPEGMYAAAKGDRNPSSTVFIYSYLI